MVFEIISTYKYKMIDFKNMIEEHLCVLDVLVSHVRDIYRLILGEEIGSSMLSLLYATLKMLCSYILFKISSIFLVAGFV